MKISVITVVYNNRAFLGDCIKSVAAQDYSNVEHVVIDGGSTDGTLHVIKEHEDSITRWISEPDGGIYDAMNKGIALAAGDVIGFLNSDDVYAHRGVLSNVARVFDEFNVDSCYGDLVYVSADDLDKVIRKWRSNEFKEENFKSGWHPPHPTFFVKRSVYERYGGFNLKYSIAADYELMLRFLVKYGTSVKYIPDVLVKMRIGGTSNGSIRNIVAANIECYSSWKENELSVSPLIILIKPFSKLSQYFA